MIFADKIIEQEPLFRELIQNSRKLRIHPDVKAMADALVLNDTGQIAKISKYACYPDYDTWIECDEPGGSFGALYQARTSVTEGTGSVFIQPRGEDLIQIPTRFDLPGYSLTWFDVRQQTRERMARTPQHLRGGAMWVEMEKRLAERDPLDPIAQATMFAPLLTAFKPQLFAILALINSPKLVTFSPVDVSRLNKHRLKRGRDPFFEHKEVRINVDLRQDQHLFGQSGEERPQHFVRAHPRFLVHPRYKKVSVVMIPPHYRGNPAVGIIETSYRADRTHSRWNKEAA